MTVRDVDQAGVAPARGLSAWRIVVWLLLLLAAFGAFQYVRHAKQVLGELQASAPTDAGARAALHAMLGWDAGYLLAALVLLAICAGCLLRRAWARPALQVSALLLVAWLLVSGVLLLMRMHALEQAHVAPPATGQVDASLQLLLAQVEENYRLARRSIELALAFKAIAVPVLLWLAWRLGRPAVRAQFRVR